MKWRIILVNFIYYEGGAKNPSKGTSMKLLVLAADAQSGVGAGSKGRNDGSSGGLCGDCYWFPGKRQYRSPGML